MYQVKGVLYISTSTDNVHIHASSPVNAVTKLLLELGKGHRCVSGLVGGFLGERQR